MLLWACCDSFSGEEESDDWDDSVCFDTFKGRDLQPHLAMKLKQFWEKVVGLLCFLVYVVAVA